MQNITDTIHAKLGNLTTPEGRGRTKMSTAQNNSASDSCAICFVCPTSLRDSVKFVAKMTKRNNSDVIRAAVFRYVTQQVNKICKARKPKGESGQSR